MFGRVFAAFSGTTQVDAITRVTDSSCPDARTGCQGICYEVPDQHFFESCLVGEAPVVEAILPTPSYDTGSCKDYGFVPLTRVPGGTSVPDFCYGDPVSRSLVDVYVSNEDWFFGATVDAGKFSPDIDCPAWQQRNPQCMKPLETTATADSKTCQDYFGDISGIVTVADPDLGIPGHTDASGEFCDKFGAERPCTYIHYAGLKGPCANPTPPDTCHRYHKVTYTEQCKPVLEKISLSGVDTGLAFTINGVLKECANEVVSNEIICWGPPFEDSQPCDCNADVVV